MYDRGIAASIDRAFKETGSRIPREPKPIEFFSACAAVLPVTPNWLEGATYGVVYEPFCICWRSLVSSNDRRGFARRTLSAILSSQPRNTTSNSRKQQSSVFMIRRVAYILAAAMELVR